MACFRKPPAANRARVTAWSLWVQGIWSAALVLPRTIHDGAYGNLYSNLLDWVISAALLFYVLAIAGLIRLRIVGPDAERPFRTPGYPMVPLFYIITGIAILYCLFAYRAATTWPGLAAWMLVTGFIWRGIDASVFSLRFLLCLYLAAFGGARLGLVVLPILGSTVHWLVCKFNPTYERALCRKRMTGELSWPEDVFRWF